MDQETLKYFQTKSTEELTEILEEQNTNIYKYEAFEIIRHILDERTKQSERYMPGYVEDLIKEKDKMSDPEAVKEVESISSINNEKNRDTSLAEKERVEKVVEPPEIKKDGFLKKLANGDYSLAKTYWIYGVLVGIIVNILLKFIESLPLLLIIYIPYLIYIIFLYRGVWNAANKYTGNITWAILAKIAVVLGVISFIYSVATVTSTF